MGEGGAGTERGAYAFVTRQIAAQTMLAVSHLHHIGAHPLAYALLLHRIKVKWSRSCGMGLSYSCASSVPHRCRLANHVLGRPNPVGIDPNSISPDVPLSSLNLPDHLTAPPSPCRLPSVQPLRLGVSRLWQPPWPHLRPSLPGTRSPSVR